MTLARTISFSKVRLLLGDGSSPEQYSAPCGLNSRALNRTKNLNEVNIPDCDDEDAPAWVGREVQTLSWGVTGDGVIAEQSIEMWEDFFNGSTSKSVRVEIELPTQAMLAYEGKAHLSNFTMGANRGEKATVTIELAGDGALVPVPIT